MKKHELICIVCPVGCHLEIQETKEGFHVEGNRCNRGPIYAKKELTHPTRVLTTTVKIKNSPLNRIPVVTKGEIPKEKIFDAMKELSKVEVQAPVKMDEIIVKNILNTGIDVIASRNMKAS
jgi:CxxC motif-containing protein